MGKGKKQLNICLVYVNSRPYLAFTVVALSISFISNGTEACLCKLDISFLPNPKNEEREQVISGSLNSGALRLKERGSVISTLDYFWTKRSRLSPSNLRRSFGLYHKTWFIHKRGTWLYISQSIHGAKWECCIIDLSQPQMNTLQGVWLSFGWTCQSEVVIL